MGLNYLVLDLETDGLDYRKDPIVAIGLCRFGQSTTIYKDQCEHMRKWWTYLQCTDLLVGHNIKFDLLFLWGCEELQDWFKQGGRIWDTQLVEYMLSGQQDKYPKLRDIAVERYGCPARTKWIDDLLFNKKETLRQLMMYPQGGQNDYIDPTPQIKLLESYQKVSDLPREKVLEDVKNDVVDTEQVYLKQLKLVQERGKNFENLVMLEHDAILATAEATYNGMFVDTKKLLENKKELETQLELKQAELMQIVGRYWR